MKLFCFFTALLLLVAAPAFSATPTAFIIEPPSDPDLAGCKLYWGNQSGAYSSVIDIKNAIEYTLELADGIWYIAATAYDTDGLESVYSNELVLKINAPPGAPGLNCRESSTVKIIINLQTGTVTTGK
jgi:hypothetical protein